MSLKPCYSSCAVILVGLLSAVTPSFASSGTEGAAFLDIPVGAGPAALGSAYTAMALDAYAPIYNPAGLGLLPSTQVAAEHVSYLQNMNYEFISAVHPLVEGKAIGFAAQYLGTGNINATGPSAESLGTYTDHYAAYSLVYGQKINEKLSLGLTGKWINAKLADVSANAYAADIGSLYQVNNRLNLAATITNIGTKLTFISQGDSLPLAGHLAAAYQLAKVWNLAVEGIYSQTGLLSGRTGIEWSPLEMIRLRVGYKTDTTKELSALAGLTVGMGLNVWGQEFAYAWLPYGDLGSTNYFSLLLRFGEAERARKNLIQFQQIKEHRSVKDSGDADETSPDTMQLMETLEEKNPNVATTTPGVGKAP